MQTNVREAREAVSSFLPLFITISVIYIVLYLVMIQKNSINYIHFKSPAIISCVSFFICSSLVVFEKQLYRRSLAQLNRYDFIKLYDYPFSLLTGVFEVQVILKNNNLDKAKDFSFHAEKRDTLDQRQVYVLIIGESCRYDRWQVNGYKRETSPRLASNKNLVTFSDVVAGAHYTWVSVPQIITRANPDNYDLQYHEKSILSVFEESGFKTIWLSNQSDQEVLWTGSIVLHAKTANVSKFSPTYSPNFEFENIYDQRLLPQLDSMLRIDAKNLFIVLHMMGNHWEYSRRYPEKFDVFKPSGYTQSINPPEFSNKEAILNSYDNSILYADFIIDSVINIVKNRSEVSTVTFISDHGEDLFDSRSDKIDFHFRPSPATLHVPLFVWTSESYRNIYGEKIKSLTDNSMKKVGTENMFYTITDLANITFTGYDSTKSLASPFFRPSEQKFYGDEKRAQLYARLPK
jgi:glucan phosphoethanolaminetransferase (alkaline phosphatase superfamily)